MLYSSEKPFLETRAPKTLKFLNPPASASINRDLSSPFQLPSYFQVAICPRPPEISVALIERSSGGMAGVRNGQRTGEIIQE